MESVIQEQVKQITFNFEKLRGEVDRFNQKLWTQVKTFTNNRQHFQLIQSKVTGAGALTKLEESDLILEELFDLIKEQSIAELNKKEELLQELKDLKKFTEEVKKSSKASIETAIINRNKSEVRVRIKRSS